MAPRAPKAAKPPAPRAAPRSEPVVAPPGAPEPPPELADLDDAGQVELVQATDNDLAAGDADLPQPGADYVPPAEA